MRTLPRHYPHPFAYVIATVGGLVWATTIVGTLSAMFV